MEPNAPFYTAPGGQPPEPSGPALAFARLPQTMRTYAMPRIRTTGSGVAFELLRRLAAVLEIQAFDGSPASFDVSDWQQADRDVLNQVLGEGEVSIVVGKTVHIQESILAGVWRVIRQLPQGGHSDTVEVGAVPGPVLSETFAEAANRIDRSPPSSADEWMNAPALLTEINEHLAACDRGEPRPHVINLTLLPMTGADMHLLMERLGAGPTAILSRGYGNCRMSSTATRSVWWVQYFNSQDALILNQLEITPIPQGACAAVEDLRDSARRLHEILQVIA